MVEHLIGLCGGGDADRAGFVVAGLVIEPLSIYLGCTDSLTTPVVIERGRLVAIGSGPPCYGEGKLYYARAVGGRHG